MSDEDPITRVLPRLPTARTNGSGWQALCPGHDDRHASLSISLGTDGRVLLCCHAGCTTRAIVTALGLSMRDLFPPGHAAAAEPAEVFEYRDEQREPCYQVVRFPGKQFRVRRPNGAGGWEWNLNGHRRVLYRLPDLKGHTVVLIAEGEKDVETLWRVGIAATTNPHGAGKWRPEYVDQLKAAGCQRVAILPDNDPPGDAHARAVAQSCHAAGLFVKIVTLPGIPPKGDVTDYLERHSREELLETIRTAPPFNPQQLAAAPLAVELTSLSQLLIEPDDQVEWLVEDRIPSAGLVLGVGPPKAGKSTFARHLTFAVATGEPFLGWRTQLGCCWYLALEEKRNEIRKAFRRLGATGQEPIRLFVNQAPVDLLQRLHQLARAEKPALIVVDTLQRLIKAKDLNDYSSVTEACAPLLALSRDTGAALLLLHHASAHGTREGLDAVLGSTALTGSVDNVLILGRTDKRRVLSSVQRIGPDLDPVILALDDQTGRVRIVGSRADVDEAEIGDRILEALRDQPAPVTETWIRQRVEARLTDQTRTLRRLLGRGLVVRSGAGIKGNPYTYALPNARSEASAKPTNGNENRERELSVVNTGDTLDFGDSRSLVPYRSTYGNENPSPPTSSERNWQNHVVGSLVPSDSENEAIGAPQGQKPLDKTALDSRSHDPGVAVLLAEAETCERF